MSKDKGAARAPLERYMRAVAKQNRAIKHACFRRPVGCWRTKDLKAIERTDNEIHVVYAQLSDLEKLMVDRGITKREAELAAPGLRRTA